MSASGPRNHARPWSERDVTALERHWGAWPLRRLTGYLGRSRGAVRSKAHVLGLLRDANTLGLPTVAAILGVGYAAVYGWVQADQLPALPRHKHAPIRVTHAALEAFIRAHPEHVLLAAMDAARYPNWVAFARHAGARAPVAGTAVRRPWTGREDAYLRNNCQQQTMTAMAAYLHRDRAAVAMRLWRLRQAHPLMARKRVGPGSGSTGRYRPWTPTEDALLLANAGRPRRADEPGYGSRVTIREVAAQLDRNAAAVKRHLERLRPGDPPTQEVA